MVSINHRSMECALTVYSYLERSMGSHRHRYGRDRSFDIQQVSSAEDLYVSATDGKQPERFL